METARSYISERAEARENGISGRGVFSREKIKAGEVVIDYTGAPGKFLPASEADVFYDKGEGHMIQVDDDVFYVPACKEELEDADFLNHSCEPNCGIRGSLQIVAMRDIEAGEEITFDYVVSESSDYQMACRCQSKNCRKIIRGSDWGDPLLREKYRGFFSDYLQKKINESQKEKRFVF